MEGIHFFTKELRISERSGNNVHSLFFLSLFKIYLDIRWISLIPPLAPNVNKKAVEVNFFQLHYTFVKLTLLKLCTHHMHTHTHTRLTAQISDISSLTVVPLQYRDTQRSLDNLSCYHPALMVLFSSRFQTHNSPKVKQKYLWNGCCRLAPVAFYEISQH